MIIKIAANTTAVLPLAEPTFIIKPKPFWAFVASTTAIYVQPIPYIIKKEFIIDGNAAGSKISVTISCERIPIDFPVSIKSCGTSSRHKIVDGRTYTNVAKNKNDTFITSSIPNHRINKGEKAVTGIYLIAETTGEISAISVVKP